MLEETRKEQAETLSEVGWREKRIPIRDENTRIALVGVRQAESQLSRARTSSDHDSILSAFHAVLTSYNDTLNAIQDVISKVRFPFPFPPPSPSSTWIRGLEFISSI